MKCLKRFAKVSGARNLPSFENLVGGAEMPKRKGPETKPRKNSPPEAEALRRLSERNMRPLEPYPGNAQIQWLIACLSCNSTRRRKLNDWKKFGCRSCSRRTPLSEVDRILSNGPLQVVGKYTDSKSVPVKCGVCDEEFNANVQSFKSRQNAPCRYCVGVLLSPKEIVRRIQDSNFELVGTQPQKVTEHFTVRCKVCKKTSPKTLSYISSGKGCVHCAPNAPVSHAEAFELFLSRNLRPRGPFPGANSGWLSLCLVCGEEPAPHYTSLAMFDDRKCEFCSGKAVNPETAEKLMRKSKFEPLEPYPGSLTPWRCRCMTCGKEPTPTYTTVKGGGRCGFCVPGGVDYKLPGILYLIQNTEKAAGKVGIQTFNSNRLRTHRKNGWTIENLWISETGEQVHAAEQSVKAKLRHELGASTVLAPEEMPVGGHTETFVLAEVSLCSVREAIEETIVNRNYDHEPVEVKQFDARDFFDWVESKWLSSE